MSNNPLVSICIPCYNAALYINKTIESIIKQTYPNIEIIIVDDGSTDNSVLVILKQIETSHISINLIKQENKGQCYAANVAFKSAKGEYIKFLDADDLINETHIELQVLALEKTKNCIAAGQVKRFYNNNIENSLEEKLANWANLTPIDWLLIDNGKGLGMMQCAMFLIPRSILDKTGLWNEALSLINDFEFFPRVLLAADEILFTEEAKVYYRSGTINSLSNILSVKALKSAFESLRLTTAKILAIEDSERSRQILGNYWSLWAYHFYPKTQDLFEEANNQIITLTGKKFKPNHSGFSQTIAFILGWKLTKRLKDFQIKQ